MGDVIRPSPWPAGIDSAKVAQAVETGFGSDSAMTEAFLVTCGGASWANATVQGSGSTPRSSFVRRVATQLRRATSSISTSAPNGSPATATVVRAG